EEEKTNMNPYDEERLRDEVIYLHSLWHQGPPQQPNPYLPFPSSSSSQPLLHRHPFAPSHTRSLLPVPSTAFKKNRKKKKGPKPDSPAWPCLHSSDSPQTGWPEPKPRSDPPPLKPQEKERFSALQAQTKACKAFTEFLRRSGSDDEEEDNDDDDSDAMLGEFEEFFIRVFMEDSELMVYYQRCFENGEFCCLVCCAAKKKSWKKYKDCVGLVQHSISILRTANKKAHRAFGQAVCKVLGWDIHRLPTIVITGEPLRCSTEGEPEKSVAADDDGNDGSHKTEE
ncbi:hypothetical protein KIW84_044086, partial [Lathyrus oleraceus]